jgi:thioredoxin reductase (NADPH)
MAVEARTAGISPDRLLVLEKAEEHSFTLKRYYPDSKLVTANYKGFEAMCTGVMCMPDLTKHETISYLDKTLETHNIPVRYRETVYKIVRHTGEQKFTVFTDRSTYCARVVAIAIGILGRPNKPAYPLPRTLKHRLLFDITTTRVAASDVLVVGGGDTASEYCQYLVQDGNRVTLSYRRNEFTRMNRINLNSINALAARKQANILYGSNITEIADSAGRPEVHFKEPQFGAHLWDFVVFALGGSTPENFLKMIGIEFEGEQPRLLHSHETSVPGMFLVGDLSAGPKGGSIIWAFNSAKTAMQRISTHYLQY